MRSPQVRHRPAPLRVFRASGLPRIPQRTWSPPVPWRRKAVAAVLAVVAGLLLLTFRTAGQPVPAAAGPVSPRPGPDEVAAPVRLADPALATLLHAGDVIDILSVPEVVPGSNARASTAAGSVRVLDVPGAASEPAGGSLVIVAVTPEQARVLAGAQASGRLSVTLLGEQSG